MKHFQRVPYALPTQTFSLGGNAVVNLRDLPKTLFGKICHLEKITFDAAYTPTTTALPTTVQNNNLVAGLDIWDGSLMRFQGSFNSLRQRERLHSGGNRVPDADTDTASGTARHFRRTWHAGPPQFVGSPTDWVIPTAYLDTAEIRIRWAGALTDFAADATVITGSVAITAWLVLLDEVRIPPATQWQQNSATGSDINLTGRALYVAIAMANDAAFGAIAAGDFGNITLDLGAGFVVPTIDGGALTAGYADDFSRGAFGVNGDPNAASDDNQKMVNTATPTALVAQTADLQPVIWSPPQARISKLFGAESVARLRWDGSQSTAIVCSEKILPQTNSVLANFAAKTLQRLGKREVSVDVKTESKKGYKGPYREFMPYVIKVA